MAISKVTAGGIADIAAALEAASDSNKFTDDDHSKLNNIEPSATADQTAAQIKTALENGIDSVHYVDGSIDTAHIGDDQVTADKLANSINSAITANTAKVTNATHTGDVTGATALTIAAGAVDIAMLSATGTAGSGNFLRGDNSWATAGSTSASDLTSGTLPIARIADDAVTAAKLANSINTDIATGPAALPKAGGTMTGNLALGDNDILRLGGENDLQIYHDGNNSYIDEQGTGALTIRSNTINLQKYTGETLAEFQADGAVTLRYDNVSKLATSSEGITVTGNTMVSEGSSFKFGGNNARIMGHSGNHRIQFLAAGYEQARLQGGLFRIGNVEASQDDGKLSVSETKNYSGGIARQQINVRDNQAATVTDNGGAIAFSGKYTSVDYTTFAQIEGVKANNTDNNYQGGLKFSARANGSSMNTVGRWDVDGIKFGGDTAATNGLDDYEEGNWSPVWDPTTSGSITTNTTYTAGIYTKVGNLVTVSWRLYTNSVNSPAGKLTINGLPFTVRNAATATPKILFPIFGLSSNLAGSPIGNLNANTTTVTVADYVWGVTESGADIAQKFDNDVWSYGTFSYFT